MRRFLILFEYSAPFGQMSRKASNLDVGAKWEATEHGIPSTLLSGWLADLQC